MRRLLGLTFLLSQCSPLPVVEPMPQQPPSAPIIRVANPALNTEPNSPPPAPPRFVQRRISGIAFKGVEFDSRSHRLCVIDQSGGPGSRFEGAAQAAASIRGLAAINGGFFTPEGKPLGLVIAGGQKSGHWNHASSLGTGFYLEADRAPRLVRRSHIDRNAATAASELLQTGPWLVEASAAVRGLDATKQRQRSLILWDGGTRWWMGCASDCSLAKLAVTLASTAPVAWDVEHALNLDGGRSSDLWVSRKLTGSKPYSPKTWPRKVRNHLVLVAR